MFTLGITGHQSLEDSTDWEWVRTTLESLMGQLPRPWQGLSSLAKGADQLFACLVVEHGGRLKAIVPNEKYAQTFEQGPDRERYFRLLRQASEVVLLADAVTAEESYLNAGKRIVDQSDRLLAVWDGQPAKGLGGTGDIVDYARSIGRQVIHINPVSHRVE